jgi:hypothetical protein
LRQLGVSSICRRVERESELAVELVEQRRRRDPFVDAVIRAEPPNLLGMIARLEADQTHAAPPLTG